MPLSLQPQSMTFGLTVPHGRIMACSKPKERCKERRAPMPKRSSSSLPMARLTRPAGLAISLLPKRLKRLNPSRRQVPRFTRSAFLRMLTRRPMSAKLQKKTSSCRRSPATTPLPLTPGILMIHGMCSVPGNGTSATNLPMQITIWRLPALMS